MQIRIIFLFAHSADSSDVRQSGDMAKWSVPARVRYNDWSTHAADKRSIDAVEMMDRPVAVTDAEAVGSGNRRADPGLGVVDGLVQWLALGKSGCDRRGQRAAGAMGVLRCDPRRGECAGSNCRDEI